VKLRWVCGRTEIFMKIESKPLMFGLITVMALMSWQTSLAGAKLLDSPIELSVESANFTGIGSHVVSPTPSTNFNESCHEVDHYNGAGKVKASYKASVNLAKHFLAESDTAELRTIFPGGDSGDWSVDQAHRLEKL
jgi:hypothetical protein